MTVLPRLPSPTAYPRALTDTCWTPEHTGTTTLSLPVKGSCCVGTHNSTRTLHVPFADMAGETNLCKSVEKNQNQAEDSDHLNLHLFLLCGISVSFSLTLKWAKKEFQESSSTLKHQQKAIFVQHLHFSLIFTIAVFERTILFTTSLQVGLQATRIQNSVVSVNPQN